MSALAPRLFNRRYGDLVQIGRSRLPGLAPEWTDHNAHDPGITLIELLAWVAEAQLYSLARTRRDERRAYAALMGIAPNGARPAGGLIWPDHDDPDSPAGTMQRSMIIEPDAAVHMRKADTPVFHPTHRLLWMPARITALESRLADGTTGNHLMANRRGGPAFQPFGAGDGRGAMLSMALAATGWAPLIESRRPRDARLVIGVRTDPSRSEGRGKASGAGSPLEVQLLTEDGQFPLPIVEDTTRGLLRTGVLVLDASAVQGSPTAATIEFRAPNGLDRAPQILRIEPNVLPVVQRRAIADRLDANGLPDQQFDLETPGLEFEPGTDPVAIEIERLGGAELWTRCERLADNGPDDRVFAFDPVAAQVLFGNGVNGAVPSAEATITARYSVSEGANGNLAANRKWTVKGLAGTFGINPDPFSGGEDSPGWVEQRRAARTAFREGHALVSSADFEEAARRVPGLDVARAWMMPPSPGDLARGTMRLVAMQARQQGREPRSIPETQRWLEAVRRALAPRTPLGSRIEVVAPRYVNFSVRARIEPEAKTDPAKVRKNVLDELARRLTLVSAAPGIRQRPFGLPVTRHDLAAWIQTLPDVRRVVELTILSGDGTTLNEVTLPRSGLPRIDLDRSGVEVVRAGTGETP